MENLNNYINEYHTKNKELNKKIAKLADNYQEVMDQVDEMDLNEDDKKKKRIKKKKE